MQKVTLHRRSKPIPNLSKIATCCYCGTRAALVLRGETRHELACASCGAPLHNLKQMPSPAKPARGAVAPQSARPQKASKKSRKKRKSRRKDWFEDIFDVIEDIFD